MKKNTSKILMSAFAAAVTVVAAVGVAHAAGAVGGCGRGIICLDVWRPVCCPDGNVYSNDCYARRACQTNCVRCDGPAI